MCFPAAALRQVHVDESFGMDANDDSGRPARQATYQGTMKLRDLTTDQSGVEVRVRVCRILGLRQRPESTEAIL